MKIPFTVKFRAGWNDRELVNVRMAKLAEDCGLQAIALHPRTREQGYSGHADWTRIAEVKAAVKIPVVVASLFTLVTFAGLAAGRRKDPGTRAELITNPPSAQTTRAYPTDCNARRMAGVAAWLVTSLGDRIYSLLLSSRFMVAVG